MRALHAASNAGRLARLVREQVDRVAGMVPEQVIGPAARLAERIHVGAAEEIGLHVHLQHLELAGLDLLVDPLVAGIEAARVAGHGDEARLLLHRDDLLGIREVVRHRDLDLHVLAGVHALDGLGGMHLRGRGEQHGVEARLLQALGEVARPVRDAELLCDFLRGVGLPPVSVMTSMPGMFAMASRCLMPNAPCPASPTFMDFA